MKPNLKMYNLLILLSLFALSCTQPQEQATEEPKADVQLVSTSPENGTSGIKGSTLEIVLTFDQNIKCPPSQQSKITVADAVIDKVVAYNKDLTLSISSLKAGKSYSLKIPEGVVSGYKNNFAKEINLTFSMAEPEKEPEYGDDGYPVPDETSRAWQISRKLGIGWNLGNHFDAHNNGVSGEQFWDNPLATQQTFTKIKAAGFSTVRIPVTWLGHIGAAPEYKIEEAWLNRVAEVVGYAEAAGLNAIINMHHDGADSKFWLNIKKAASDPEAHKQIKEQIDAMWFQIAEKFKDKGDFLIFEAFNEIHDGGWGWGGNRNDGGKQYKCLNEWNQTFVSAVRRSGGNNAERILGIPAYCTNVDIAIDSFEWPQDTAKDCMMLSVHCYDPSTYTLEAKYSEWGHTAQSSKKANGDNEADLKSVFVKLYKHYISKGLPVYLGEFGCVNRESSQDQAFQQYYLRYFAALSRLYGVPSIIWDNGSKSTGRECHGFINHGTGEWQSAAAQKAIQEMLKSYNSDSKLEDIYKTAP